MSKANIITILRILLVPIFLVILMTEMENKEIVAFIIFLIASLTDAVDGYIARKFDQVTDLGKFLDPIADKLLITAALIALVSIDVIETWVASIIILREIFITAFRFYFLMKDASFSASRIAKNKTTFQIIAISILIIYKKLPYSDILFKIGTITLYIAVFLTVYSGVEYLIKYSTAQKNKK
ncbi:MAG: CDP-diacylglycerol--glycerol-3-phosphate 3-phosphatidyltransferase [Acidobacteriota bacterium]